MQTQVALLVSLALFCIGLVLVTSKRNSIAILMGIELIFNASHLNIIVFGLRSNAVGSQIFTLFSIIIAACETALGLAIILQIFKKYKTNDLNEIK